MAIRDSQFNKLEERVNVAFEQIARIEGHAPSPNTSKTPSIRNFWIAAGSVIATILLAAIAATHLIDEEISNKYDSLDSRVTKAEGAIKALAAQQSTQTQTLVQNLLAAATSNSNPVVASRAFSTAASITETLREKKVPAEPQFFKSAFADLNTVTPATSPDAFRAKVALAEYRSSLANLNIPASAIHCAGTAAQQESFKGILNFSNMTLVDCVMTLDQHRLNHVAFINAHIVYKGGPVQLKDVLFVNCTFQVTPNERGSQLLEYAALDEQELSVSS